MQIKQHEIQNFKIEKINFFLLYGINSGLIEETINKTFKPKFSKNIIKLEEYEILNKIESFKEMLFNKSFFEDDKLIIIKNASDKILNLIKEVIEQDLNDIKIIITCSILEKKSKLRNFFEKDKNAISIPFYEDNYQSLIIFAQNFLKEHKIKISNENINLIIERSRGNRINLLNELEKISSFSNKKQEINFKDIAKLTNLAENYSISSLVDYCLVKNKRKTLNILNENNLKDDENILIVKSFLYKLKRLKIIKNLINKNKNIDQVLISLRPPVFWKDKDILKQQLNVLSLSEIKYLIGEVNNLELQIKKNYQISNQILNNFILKNLESTNNAI
jgi:DNA polymerase-3 subunit delta